jgi:hypothetical protein
MPERSGAFEHDPEKRPAAFRKIMLNEKRSSAMAIQPHFIAP